MPAQVRQCSPGLIIRGTGGGGQASAVTVFPHSPTLRTEWVEEKWMPHSVTISSFLHQHHSTKSLHEDWQEETACYFMYVMWSHPYSEHTGHRNGDRK